MSPRSRAPAIVERIHEARARYWRDRGHEPTHLFCGITAFRELACALSETDARQASLRIAETDRMTFENMEVVVLGEQHALILLGRCDEVSWGR